MALRKKIVEGRYTLPVVCTTAVALWLLAAGLQWHAWAGLGLVLLTGYLLLEMNNRLALLQMRSRAVSSTFLVLSALALPLHGEFSTLLAALMLALMLVLLFSMYRDASCVGRTFYLFLLLGLASLLVPPLVLLMPLWWCFLAWGLQSFTLRGLLASLMGVALPFALLAAGLYLWNVPVADAAGVLPALRLLDDVQMQGLLVQERWDVLRALPLGVQIAWGLLVFFTFFASIHFFRTSYSDRVRVRLYYNIFFFTLLLLGLSALLWPCYAPTLLASAFVVGAPLIARYVAYARGRLADWWFALWLMLLVVWGVMDFRL